MSQVSFCILEMKDCTGISTNKSGVPHYCVFISIHSAGATRVEVHVRSHKKCTHRCGVILQNHMQLLRFSPLFPHTVHMQSYGVLHLGAISGNNNGGRQWPHLGKAAQLEYSRYTSQESKLL